MTLQQAPSDAPFWGEFLRIEILLPKILETVVVIAVAVLVYRLIRLLIAKLVAREIEDEDPVEKRLRQQRSQTLASLLGSVALVVIATLTGLTVLANFIDIAPVLASVGVLGLAISFGAQSLVKDVITGTFLLLEGQFAVGDVVRIADVSGQVERITLRTTVLRDLHGTVHTVPNGQIDRVSNLTKSWSRAVLDIGVAYKEDVDHVIDVMRAIGEELYTDAVWKPQLLSQPDVLGVDSLGDSAVVIRMVAQTLPQQQFPVGRELRRRIKKRFDAEGIEIPFPHITMYWGDGQNPREARDEASTD
jgi:moderate conductance mechanosensitive channel